MKTKLLVIGALLIALIIGVWYYIASNTYKAYTEEFQALNSQIDKIHSTFLESGRAKREVRYDDLSEFVNTYKTLKQDLIRIQNNLKNGEGLSFWFPDAREQASARILAYVTSEDTILNNSEIALSDVSSIHNEVVQLLTRSSAERSKALSLLNPNSDSEDFRIESKEVNNISIELSNIQPKVASLKEIKVFGGMSEALRIGMLTYMQHILRDENTAIDIREKALLAADRQLIAYKESVSKIVSSQSGIITSMNSIAVEFRPVVSLANEKVQPVRNMIDELEKPLFRDNITSGLSSLFGGSSGEPLSAMSLISSVDPSTGQMISLIKDICDGMASVHNEINGVIEATQPFLNASQQFQYSRSRNMMLGVIESAPKVASYYESKRSIFDPITSKLDEGRDAISRLNSAASRVRITGARNLISQLTNGAYEIISIAYRPFNQWQQTVTRTTESMSQLGSLENQYAQVLNQLRSDQIDNTAMTSFQNASMSENVSLGDNPIAATNIDFKNQTYNIGDRKYTFVNGKYKDPEISDAVVNLDAIWNTHFTGTSNEYTLFFEGAWGGGNTVYGEILLVRIEGDEIRKLDQISSSAELPKIINDELIVTAYRWLENDAHCCPSYKIMALKKWTGQSFETTNVDEQKLTY